MLRFSLASAVLTILSVASAGEISTSNVYEGKTLSFCGRVECVSSAMRASTEKPDARSIQFTVRQPDAVFHLEFEVSKNSENASLLKSGATVRAKGVCKEFSSSPVAPDEDDKRPRILLRMEEGSVEALEEGKDPEGFVCEAAKPGAEPQSETEAAKSVSSDVKKQAKESSSSQKKKPVPAPAAHSSSSINESDLMRSIVTVQGDNASGSAFIANVKGRLFLITNIHVIFDNEPKFLSISNEKLEVGPPLLANDRDIALYELKNPEKLSALELEDDVVSLPPEEPLIVFGNSMGAGVNTRLKGNVKGVGPSTIEISAKIVPGNSGSAIIDFKTGKVIGVSTYGLSRAKASVMTKGTRFEEVRRFGTRVDNLDLDALEPFDARKYAADVKAYKELVALNELGYAFLSDIYAGKDGKLNLTLSPSRYDFAKYSGLERLVNDWNNSLRNGSADSIPSLLTRMKDQVSKPAEKLRKQKAGYAWTKSSMERLIEVNDSYAKAIDNLRKEIEEALKR